MKTFPRNRVFLKNKPGVKVGEYEITDVASGLGRFRYAPDPIPDRPGSMGGGPDKEDQPPRQAWGLHTRSSTALGSPATLRDFLRHR